MEAVSFIPDGELVTVGNPAAGAVPQAYTVPSTQRQQPLLVSMVLTTSATVANRTVSFTVSRAGTTFYASPATAAEAASNGGVTLEWIFGQPGSDRTTASPKHYYVPALSLNPGDVITWSVANIQVADQVSAQVYFVALQ